jgi:hypothetical protein
VSSDRTGCWLRTVCRLFQKGYSSPCGILGDGLTKKGLRGRVRRHAKRGPRLGSYTPQISSRRGVSASGKRGGVTLSADNNDAFRGVRWGVSDPTKVVPPLRQEFVCRRSSMADSSIGTPSKAPGSIASPLDENFLVISSTRQYFHLAPQPRCVGSGASPRLRFVNPYSLARF